MKRTIDCESDWNEEAVGDGGLAYGIAQFHEKTFDWMKGLAKRDDLLYKERDDQIELMAWAFSNGYAHHWSCYQPNP